MKNWGSILSLILGLAVLAWVLLRFDVQAVLAAMARVGIGGFALIVLAGLLEEAALASGMSPLLPRPIPFRDVWLARQLRDSAGDVLPITQLGGMAAAARALVLLGLKGAEALAVEAVDVTTELFAQSLFILMGVAVSFSLLRADATLSPLMGAILGGAVLLALGSIGFALLQMRGSRWVEIFSLKLISGHQHHIEAFRTAIHAVYRRRDAVALSVALHLVGWVSSGLWLWLMLRLMDTGAAIGTAIAIASLVEGLRSAMVFVPAAIGVQEVGYVALAPAFGLSPDIGLALSLLSRARDVVVGVPVLIGWQALEAARQRRRRIK